MACRHAARALLRFGGLFQGAKQHFHLERPRRITAGRRRLELRPFPVQAELFQLPAEQTQVPYVQEIAPAARDQPGAVGCETRGPMCRRRRSDQMSDLAAGGSLLEANAATNTNGQQPAVRAE